MSLDLRGKKGKAEKCSLSVLAGKYIKGQMHRCTETPQDKPESREDNVR